MISPLAGGNNFSPLSPHGDHVDIGVGRRHAIADPLETYELGDDGELVEEDDISNIDVEGAITEAEDHRPFIPSPTVTIEVSGENRGADPSSTCLPPTSPPPPPGRPRSSMHSIFPPHFNRIRVGGSPAGKERSPRVPIVAKMVVSRHVQVKVYQMSVGSQASLLRAPRMLGAVVKDRWATRKRKAIEKFISNNIVGVSSWVNGGDGSRHVHVAWISLFNTHPMLLSGVIDDIDHLHKAFKILKAGLEADLCGELQDQLDSITGPLYALSNLSETGYHKLINSLSWKYDHEQGRHRRIRFKWGIRMPRLMSQMTMLVAKERFMHFIGLVRGKNQAHIDTAIVIIRRIKVLVQQSLLVLTPGLELRVQILGEATGI